MRFGGLSLAWLEDRKFKTGDKDNLSPAGAPYPLASLDLLGTRQEAFLAAWSRMDPGLPKVCLTQTLWACLKTAPDGTLRRDTDSGGYPFAARDRALGLVKQAGAVLLSGDQHLSSLVQHGLTGFTDGPVQFTSPAVGTAWQRWFTPTSPLAQPEATPHTGDVTDPYGNRLHVLAVANPRISCATYRATYPGTRQEIGDRALKCEGYGVLRVDKAARAFIFQCWPYDARPAGPTAQYAGWPWSLDWDEA
jgi:alkaline phosphatase D